MNKQLLARVLATTGALIICGAALADVWLFFGFTRYYFPKSEVGSLMVHFLAWIPTIAYFASVAFTARWAPWKRNA